MWYQPFICVLKDIITVSINSVRAGGVNMRLHSLFVLDNEIYIDDFCLKGVMNYTITKNNNSTAELSVTIMIEPGFELES